MHTPDDDLHLSARYDDLPNYDSTTSQELFTSKNNFQQTLKSINAGGHKYTGRFGGSDGVLTPEGNRLSAIASNNGSGANSKQGSSQTFFTSTNSFFTKGPTTTGAVAGARAGGGSTATKFTGSFGGPPGVLVPYDSVSAPKLLH